MGNCRLSLVSQSVLTTCISLALLACGGGGGGGGSGTANAPAMVGVDGGSPNRPPTIGGNPATQVMAGTNYRFRPNASDPDGDGLSFRVANKPPWATFSQSTGQLEGRPKLADIGAYNNIKIEVNDGVDTVHLATFQIVVQGTATGSFTLSWIPPTTNTDGSLLFDLAGYRIYLGRQPGNYYSILEINNPGLTAYVFDQLAPGTYFVAITAVDRNGNESPRSVEVRTTV